MRLKLCAQIVYRVNVCAIERQNNVPGRDAYVSCWPTMLNNRDLYTIMSDIWLSVKQSTDGGFFVSFRSCGLKPRSKGLDPGLPRFRTGTLACIAVCSFLRVRL